MFSPLVLAIGSRLDCTDHWAAINILCHFEIGHYRQPFGDHKTCQRGYLQYTLVKVLKRFTKVLSLLTP